MAKKGQKFKKYSNGEIATNLAKEYDVPVDTIYMWDYNVKHLRIGKKRGRPKQGELTKEDYKERYEILKKYQAFLQARRGKK